MNLIQEYRLLLANVKNNERQQGVKLIKYNQPIKFPLSRDIIYDKILSKNTLQPYGTKQGR